ncbi:MAG: NADH:flavin oxidoreductase [Methanoregula sp.]|jgi:2,4-dienoyl-CoA reductase-like NADH-dependent reductase (Old Yellow Enzyme family)|nr:NADH:flavin oxidoreductase [Methanoregula sp.]
MKTLFDETCIGTIQLRNRLVRSSTWEAMADETGRPTPRLIQVYHDLAYGGTGLIITSATTIAGDATHPPGMLAINDNSSIPAFQELARTVHEAGVPIVMQLVHPGRDGVMWTPKDATLDDIQAIVKGFGDAAIRAQKAGFDGVEIHAAHGYFLSQFMNVRKNTRTDEYGGPVENRMRFLLEIAEVIRARTGETFPVLVKINCSDFEEDDGVWDATRAACKDLAKFGISAFEISGGVNGAQFPPQGLPYEESIFRDYATEIARTTAVPVILVGCNRTPSVMTELLNTSGIRYFSLSRPFLRQPDLADYWKENPDRAAECISCDSCRNQPDGNVCPFRESPGGEI